MYHDVFSVCDMFDARDGVGKAELLPATGKYYYEPIKEVKHCMDSEFLFFVAFNMVSYNMKNYDFYQIMSFFMEK